jgi:hypothetical protein
MSSLNLVPATGGKGARKSLDELEDFIGETVLEAFAYNGSEDDVSNGRLATEAFADSEEAEDFLRDCRAFAYQNEPRLVVTGNLAKAPGWTKETPVMVAKFKVDPYVKPE